MEHFIKSLAKKSGFRYSTHKHYIIYWFLVIIGFVTFSVITFNLLQNNENSENYIHWMINYKAAGNKSCEVYTELGYAFIIGYSYSFAYSGIIGGVFGAVLGAMNTDKHFGKAQRDWWETSYLKRGLRALLSLVVSIGCFV